MSTLSDSCGNGLGLVTGAWATGCSAGVTVFCSTVGVSLGVGLAKKSVVWFCSSTGGTGGVWVFSTGAVSAGVPKISETFTEGVSSFLLSACPNDTPSTNPGICSFNQLIYFVSVSLFSIIIIFWSIFCFSTPESVIFLYNSLVIAPIFLVSSNIFCLSKFVTAFEYSVSLNIGTINIPLGYTVLVCV